MFDLDFFKQINDGYGHAAGDEEALRAFAKAAGECLRGMDVLGRRGRGIRHPVAEHGADQAEIVAERIRAAVTEIAIETEYGTVVSRPVSVWHRALKATIRSIRCWRGP